MKLKFKQSLSSANGLTYLETQTIEAFKFLFLSTDPHKGVVIYAPVLSNLSGIPELTIIEKRDRSIHSDPPAATLLTRNSDVVRSWLDKGELIISLESEEALKHEINYENNLIHFVVLSTRIVKVDKHAFSLTNTFCVKFKTGRFAGESFFLLVTFEINHSSSMIPNFSVCLSKLKANQLFDASGLLMLE